MSNKSSKTKIEAYGEAADKLWGMNRSFSPFLMVSARMSTVLSLHPFVKDLLGDDDPEHLALLQEFFYDLMLIYDCYRDHSDLDDSEVNHARRIMDKE